MISGCPDKVGVGDCGSGQRGEQGGSGVNGGSKENGGSCSVVEVDPS